MKTKKTKKADLENKRPVFFMVGLIISLSAILLAFEWKTPANKIEDFGELKLEIPPEDLTPLIREEKKEVAPPVRTVVEFVLADNDMEIDESLEIFDSEITENEAINYQDFLPKKTDEEEEDLPPVWIADEMPEFPGGMPSLLKFIATSIRYPVVAQENGVKGKVIITFVIDKSGDVTNVRVFRGIDPSLDAEALRVVKTLPRWKPGKQNGRTVKVNYNVPINFVLQ